MPIRISNNNLGTFLGEFTSEPSFGQDADTYINTSNNKFYMFYGSTWQELHTLTPAAVHYLTDPDGNILTDPDGNLLIAGN